MAEGKGTTDLLVIFFPSDNPIHRCFFYNWNILKPPFCWDFPWDFPSDVHLFGPRILSHPQMVLPALWGTGSI
jgi:hypothetical protein